MKYSISGDFYRVMRITGPTHNLLGLAFSEVGPPTVQDFAKVIIKHYAVTLFWPRKPGAAGLGRNLRVLRDFRRVPHYAVRTYDHLCKILVTVERLAGSSERPIDDARLEKAVASSVEEANKAFGTGYCLKRIEYVPTDTPDLETYSYLARMIVERLASGVEFDDVSPQNAREWRSAV